MNKQTIITALLALVAVGDSFLALCMRVLTISKHRVEANQQQHSANSFVRLPFG